MLDTIWPHTQYKTGVAGQGRDSLLGESLLSVVLVLEHLAQCCLSTNSGLGPLLFQDWLYGTGACNRCSRAGWVLVFFRVNERLHCVSLTLHILSLCFIIYLFPFAVLLNYF